jgi:type VI secretion system protein VasD
MTKDLFDQQDLLLTPGSTKSVTVECKPGAKFFGVAASFRDIDDATWRGDLAIPPNKTTKIKIDVAKLKVTVAPGG